MRSYVVPQNSSTDHISKNVSDKKLDTDQLHSIIHHNLSLSNCLPLCTSIPTVDNMPTICFFVQPKAIFPSYLWENNNTICNEVYTNARSLISFCRSYHMIEIKQPMSVFLQLLTPSNSLRMVSSNISFHVSTGPGMHQCRQS